MKLAPLLLALLGLCPAASCLADSVDIPYDMGGTFSLPVTSMKGARFRAMIRQQYDFSCGSAALSTLLTYHYGYKVSEEQIFAEMYAKGDQPKIRQEGFSLFDMKRYLENHGFQADGFEASLDKLEAAGIPAIVLINENGYNHFVVVKGLRDGRVLVGDPSGGTRAVSLQAFQGLWTNGILFVVSNHQDQARFNVAAEWSALPKSPLESGISREGLSALVLPKAGPSDF
ncbi:MAG TPA: C39 family peptidase [Rubrivivax sp.]|nr:C39 family peptidase [Rubrivivax sp.]